MVLDSKTCVLAVVCEVKDTAGWAQVHMFDLWEPLKRSSAEFRSSFDAIDDVETLKSMDLEAKDLMKVK
jgi:hypothetical protein